MTVKMPDDKFPGNLLSDFASHPIFTSMALSRKSGSRSSPGWWTVTYTFEGFLLSIPEPTYELATSLSTEPIQTHPDFTSVLAGTPAAPLNGAIFVDAYTGWQSENTDAVFKEFKAGDGMTKAGVDSYLVPGAEWRKMSFQQTRPTGIRDVGTIDSPSGPAPTVSGRDWLAWSESYLRRGNIYQLSTVWKLSGRNGWDDEIY